jgi:hypothetical protein
MDHTKATKIQAAERYTLNELTIEEREAFEDHYFSCEECANAVRTYTVLAVHTEAIAKEESSRPSNAGRIVAIARPARPVWREWLLAAAAVLLLGLNGVQYFASTRPGPMESATLRPLSRGGTETTLVHTNGDLQDLELNAPKDGVAYEVTVLKAGGATDDKFAAAPAKYGLLHVKWPGGKLGDYQLEVRDPKDSSTKPDIYSLHFER